MSSYSKSKKISYSLREKKNESFLEQNLPSNLPPNKTLINNKCADVSKIIDKLELQPIDNSYQDDNLKLQKSKEKIFDLEEIKIDSQSEILNNSLEDDDVWIAAESYFKSNSLVSHQISHYNKFIESISELLSIHGHITVNINDVHYDIKMSEPFFDNPKYVDKSENHLELTPIICLQQGFSYTSQLYINITILHSIPIGKDGKRSITEHTYSKVKFGFMPVMVRSILCNLTKYKNDPIKLVQLNEDLYDPGGYFLAISKNEGRETQKYIIVPQERPKHNNIYVFSNKKTKSKGKAKYTLYAEIRSVVSTHSTNTIVGIYGDFLSVLLPYVDTDIPLSVMFFALGAKSYKEIVEYILGKEYNNEEYRNDLTILEKSLEINSNLTDQDSSLLFIGKHIIKKQVTSENEDEDLGESDFDETLKEIVELSNTDPITHIANVLTEIKNNRDKTEKGESPQTPLQDKNLSSEKPLSKAEKANNVLKIKAKLLLLKEFLPHLNCSTKLEYLFDNSDDTIFTKKRLFLGLQVRYLLDCYFHRQEPRDRDHYGNKIQDTIFALLTKQFTAGLRRLAFDIKSMIEENIKKQIVCDILGFINDKHITFITNSLSNAIINSNWVPHNPASKGITQIHEQFNVISSLCSLRKTSIPLETKGGGGKILAPRDIHPSQMFGICIAETPEGRRCGLVRFLAILTIITIGIDHDAIKILLYHILTKQNHFQFYTSVTNLHDYTKILIAGDILGQTSNPEKVVSHIRKLRRNGDISSEISVCHDIYRKEIRITTEYGRLCTPFFIIENGKLITTREDLDKVARGDERWDYLLRHGIELIDKEEEDNIVLLDFPSNFADKIKNNQKYTHCTIHPSFVYGVAGSLVEYANFNQSPRNTYNAAMVKQAVSFPFTNFRTAKHGTYHILNYPQLKFSTTRSSDVSGISKIPLGQNAMVIIYPLEHNEEDSSIMSRFSNDMGFMNSSKYINYFVNITENPDIVFRVPSPDDCNISKSCPDRILKHYYVDPKTKKEYPYIVGKGCKVYKGDIIVAKLSKNKTKEKEELLKNKLSKEIAGKDEQQNGIFPSDNLVLDESQKKIKKFIDKCEVYSHDLPGVVDSISISEHGDGDTYANITIVQSRYPLHADKFCYWWDHDVLTSKGWKPIYTITLDDELATLSPEGILVYEKPIATHKIPVPNDMIEVDTDQINLCITPNHEMYISFNNPNTNAYSFKKEIAMNLFDKKVYYKKNAEWLTPGLKTFMLPFHNSKLNELREEFIELPIYEFIVLYALFISKGWIDKDCITIALKDKETIDILQTCLLHLHFEYIIGKTDNVVHVLDKHLLNYLSSQNLKPSLKKFDDWVWKLNKEQCQLLLQYIFMNDKSYNTISISLKNDLQKLSLHAGWAANASIIYPKGYRTKIEDTVIIYDLDIWKVTLVEDGYPVVNEENNKGHHYWINPDNLNYFYGLSNFVYCVTVPYGVIYVKRIFRDNKIVKKPLERPSWCGNCYWWDHDVLTNKGWKPIHKVTLEDKLAGLTETGHLVYENPTEIYKIKAPEDMIEVNNNQVNLCVTANHDMYVSTNDRGTKKYQKIEAQELFDKQVFYKKDAEWDVPGLDYFLLPEYQPKREHDDPVKEKKLPINEFIQLYGIFIAEGWANEKNRLMCIAAYKKRVMDVLVKIVPKLGYKYTIGKDNAIFQIFDRQLISYFALQSPTAPFKTLGSWVWKLNKEQCQLLIESMALGDGHLNGNTPMYDTSSIKLKNDIQRLALHAGWAANAYVRYPAGWKTKIEGKEVTANYDAWRITIVKTQLKPAVNKHIKGQQYWVDPKTDIDHTDEGISDFVYCVTVPSGVIYVKRFFYNNEISERPVWCGNCFSIGQKGVNGMQYNKEDLPFNIKGETPDVIMNPLAFPSRMTIGLLIEILLGKALCARSPLYSISVNQLKNQDTLFEDRCLNPYSCELPLKGDTTPFRKFDRSIIENELKKHGLEKLGDEMFMNGITGEVIKCLVFYGCAYYHRLRHFALDKIHSRDEGNKSNLTRQPTEGRRFGGGLRIGVMERDGILGQGADAFKRDRMMEQSDEFFMWICCVCGLQVNVLEDDRNSGNNGNALSASPSIIDYGCSVCGRNKVTRIRLPYGSKLVCQELIAMGIVPRILTENIEFDQMISESDVSSN